MILFFVWNVKWLCVLSVFGIKQKQKKHGLGTTVEGFVSNTTMHKNWHKDSFFLPSVPWDLKEIALMGSCKQLLNF